MSVKNDIKSYIVKEGLTVAKVAEMLNDKNSTEYTRQNLTKKINNESLRYTDAIDIADVLGYDIVWKKRE